MNVRAVESFLFQIATDEDKRTYDPGFMAKAKEKVDAAVNTLALVKSGGDLYKFFGNPIPKGTPCKVLKTFTGMNWYVFSSPEMLRSIAKEYRHSHNQNGLFANDVAAQTFIDIGTEIFGQQLDPEDTISTSTEVNNSKYRMLVMRHIGSKAINHRLDEIDQLAGDLFDQEGIKVGKMNITEVCQKLVSRLINRFLLNLDDADSMAVSKAIVAANAYILAKATGFANKDVFEPHAQALRNAIDKALKNDTPFINELNASDLTLIQKKVMIIVIYFTSLGGTISQISGLMWHLAKNSKYQAELFNETKHAPDNTFPFTAKLLKESFRIHPSTLTIDRPTRTTLLMTHHYNEQEQKMIIPEKSILTFYQPWAAEDCENPKTFNPHRSDPVELYPFGQGKHMCVAKFFSEELIGRFARVFTNRYTSSSPLTELPLQGYFNLEPQGNVILDVLSRTTTW